MESNEQIAAFVAERWPRMVRSARLLGLSAPDAEDAVQVALVQCIQAWPRVQGARDVDAYVYRVLSNVLSKSRRRKWWAETPVASVPDAIGVADAAEVLTTRDAVSEALLQLPLAQRKVVVLRFMADLSEAQVAHALKVPVGTVKSRVSRALAQLSQDPALDALVTGRES